MRKSFFLLIALFALTLHTNAQVMEWYSYWGSNVAGSQIQPVRMVVDNAGDIYTAARFGGSSVQVLDQTVPSQSGTDLGDAIITKMTPEKVAVWSHKLVSSGEATVSDMVIDNEGNLVVTGTFKGTLQGDDTNSMTMEDPSGYVALSIFVIRYDANGNVLNMWQLPTEEATVESVSVDGDDNIIISGTFGSEMSFDPANLNSFVGSTQYWNQLYVAKYSKEGTLVWAKYQQTSDASFVNAFSKVDAEGNIFVTGAFSGTTTLAGATLTTNTAINDLFLVKYTPTGDESWVNHIKGSRSDKAVGIEISPIGDVAVLSSYRSEDITINQSTDTLQNGFAKTGDATADHLGVFTFNKDNGDYRWWYSFGQGSTVGGGGSIAYYIRATNEGVWYVGGSMSSRFCDLYTHANFGGNDAAGIRTVDGIWTVHNTNGGADALYLVLTREGKLASIARPGGTQTEAIKDIALSPDKNHIYMLLEIKARANVIYTSPDNMFDSFTDFYTKFPDRRSMYTLLQVYCPETPVDNKYTSAYVGFTSTLLGKYKLPEITPNQLPEFTVGVEYNQQLAIASPAGDQKFYQLAIPEELNFYNNALIGTISRAENLYFGVIATDSTANPVGGITYYAQDPNGESIRGRSRNVRYMPLNVKDDTSVRNPLAANATFYPAVTSEVLNIKSSEANYVVNLYNNLGQMVGKYNNPTSISVRNLPAGLYHAQLKSMTGAVKTAKFIIE